MTAAYYNENDAFAAEWLRKLILFGHIAPGDVDERSIEDVKPDDLDGYEQCHFFAGIGVWSYALRCAGWADDRPIWTGSCPCQPFSAAGKRGGVADERHLWPAWHWLVEQRRPSVVVGEQVASKGGMAWLDLVSADMEGSGYAFGAADLCAAGFGAPHIRQRNYFVAMEHDASNGRIERWTESSKRRAIGGRGAGGRGAGGLDDDASARHDRTLQRTEGDSRDETRLRLFGSRHGVGGLADKQQQGSQGRTVETVSGAGRREEGNGSRRSSARLALDERTGPINGYWRDADWLFCRDGKWRPVEPGTFPLAHGVAGRVGLLRGFGNAIVAPVAAGFIEAVMGCMP